MKILIATIMQLRSGDPATATQIVREIDRHLAGMPGFIESYEPENDVQGATSGRGRIWESREATDHAAKGMPNRLRQPRSLYRVQDPWLGLGRKERAKR